MDEQGFTEAVNVHRDMLYRVAYTVLHNSEDCADALQEALIKGWTHLRELNDDARFRPWMARIVVNCSRDMLRRRRVRTVALTEDIPAPAPEDAVLDEALTQLSEGLRLPLTLYYMEGMTVQEVAQTLRLPQGTVRNRMHRGRMKLAVLLDKEDE